MVNWTGICSSLENFFFSFKCHMAWCGLITLQAHKSSVCSCCCLVAQSRPTLCNPINCNQPGLSVHEISQERIPERVTISLSKGSSWHRDWTRVSCLAGRFFTTEPPGKPQKLLIKSPLQVGWTKVSKVQTCPSSEGGASSDHMVSLQSASLGTQWDWDFLMLYIIQVALF